VCVSDDRRVTRVVVTRALSNSLLLRWFSLIRLGRIEPAGYSESS
jgi:hypothetical protein